MREVTQVYVQGPSRTDGHTDDGIPGDCWRSALASLLDLEPEEVPHFALYRSWWPETRRWLQGRGLDLVYIEAGEQRLELVEADLPVMVGGRSPRGDFGHAVVGTVGGQLVWDPHPSRAGIRSFDEFFILVEPYGFMEERMALPCGTS